jgi:hypothetical protein
MGDRLPVSARLSRHGDQATAQCLGSVAHRSPRAATLLNCKAWQQVSCARDFDAVRAALTLPYSNGQTEGQVNKLKSLKRQMYGHATFEVLRRRVLHAV